MVNGLIMILAQPDGDEETEKKDATLFQTRMGKLKTIPRSKFLVLDF